MRPFAKTLAIDEAPTVRAARPIAPDSGAEDDDVVDVALDAAARLVSTGKHDEAIAMYRDIVERDHALRGVCECLIGLALFYGHRYESAIAYYKAAAAHGEDPATVNALIQQAF